MATRRNFSYSTHWRPSPTMAAAIMMASVGQGPAATPGSPHRYVASVNSKYSSLLTPPYPNDDHAEYPCASRLAARGHHRDCDHTSPVVTLCRNPLPTPIFRPIVIVVEDTNEWKESADQAKLFLTSLILPSLPPVVQQRINR